MTQRIAASLALLVFAVCLVEGGLRAGNSFATTATRALVAMAVTWVVGLGIGWMARRMLDENLRQQEISRKKSAAPPTDVR
jgi:uncharacterized membrane protein YccC